PLILYFSWSSAHPHLHPFPPRRSSDLSVSRASPRMVFTTRDRRWVKLSSMRGVSLTLAGSRRASGTPGRSPRDGPAGRTGPGRRSEEHTSELQSRENIVCRLLLEKKKY